MTIKVNFDTLPFTLRMNDFVKKQFPFAAANALNDVAFAARQHVVSDVNQAFTIRRSGKASVPSRINVNTASKKNLTVEIGSRDEFMVLQATGGTKTIDTAIPSTFVRPSFSDLVPRSKFPRKVVNKKKRNRPFFVKFQSGKKALVERQSKKRVPLNILWWFPSTVKIKKRFALHEVVERTVQSDWGPAMLKNLERALKGAK